MLCREVTWLTKFLIFWTFVLGGISAITLFVFSEETSMLICRVLSVAGAFCLCFCSAILCKAIFRPGIYGPLNQSYHISTSIKLFLFVMTFISLTGYYFRLPNIYILHEFDFALNYTYFWPMIISDVFYIGAIIIYLLLQLFYLWFFIPSLGFFESRNERYIKYIFGFTLVINFWQKWLFETLIAREEICEELFKHNRKCIGHRHYHTNITMLSEAEQQAYYLMEMISPISYSCTMELLVVYLVVLCYSKPTTHPQEHRIKFSSKKTIFSIPFPKVYIFSMVFVIISACMCLTAKLITLFHDDENHRIPENDVYHCIKLTSLVAGCLLFAAFCWGYKSVKPKRCNPNGMEETVGCQKWGFCFPKCCICGLCSSTNEPDLLILQLTWWTSLGLILANTGFQSVGYIYGGLIDIDKLLFTIIPNLISMISFALNFKLLRSFLTTDSETFEQLACDRFTTRYMIPYQIIRSFIRAANRFIVVLDPEITLNSHDFIDQWVALFNAVYPFTPLINITSALCWSHVMEKFYSKGAYSFFTKESQNFSKRRESF